MYRCYYTGVLELPESYDALQLRQGSKDGCSLNPRKYDVFFYPIEAVASGHAPVSQTLASAAPERIAMIVPHEDFHAQIAALPDRIAEAASTLAGFVVGAEVIRNNDANLFLQKAEIVNRHYDELHSLYQAVRDRKLSRPAAIVKKAAIFAAIDRECASIEGESRAFNKRLSALNNAGLAFDYTYTKYYPLLYHVLLACERDSKCTIEAMANAPKKRTEQQVADYFEAFIKDRRLP